MDNSERNLTREISKHAMKYLIIKKLNRHEKTN